MDSGREKRLAEIEDDTPLDYRDSNQPKIRKQIYDHMAKYCHGGDDPDVQIRGILALFRPFIARLRELEVIWRRILACHEDYTGPCFDCRGELVRVGLLEGRTDNPPEWVKYFAAVNRIDELERELHERDVILFQREQAVTFHYEKTKRIERETREQCAKDVESFIRQECGDTYHRWANGVLETAAKYIRALLPKEAVTYPEAMEKAKQSLSMACEKIRELTPKEAKESPLSPEQSAASLQAAKGFCECPEPYEGWRRVWENRFCERCGKDIAEAPEGKG